jgi:hypothetical protein
VGAGAGDFGRLQNLIHAELANLERASVVTTTVTNTETQAEVFYEQGLISVDDDRLAFEQNLISAVKAATGNLSVGVSCTINGLSTGSIRFES